MGLDMFLTKKTYIGGKYEHNNIAGEINLTKKGIKIPIELNKLTYINEEVGYWRKANQIHNWFVDNVQDGEDDCGSYNVNKEQIKELLILCKKVHESSELVDGIVTNGYSYHEDKMTEIFQESKVIKDASVAKELLPYKSGFFFGSTAYDEWYIENIKDTITILENALSDIETAKQKGISIEFEYHASW